MSFWTENKSRICPLLSKTSFHFSSTWDYMCHSPPGIALTRGGRGATFPTMGSGVGSGFEFCLCHCLAGWLREVMHPLIWEGKKKEQLVQGKSLEVSTAPVPHKDSKVLSAWVVVIRVALVGVRCCCCFPTTSGFQNQIMKQSAQHLCLSFS